jgi:[ribosomal protein S5]-alanine N-acetyltransferase
MMIRGKRVCLRAVEADDVALYHRWINDEESNVTRGLYLPTSHVACEAFVGDLMKQSSEKISFSIAVKNKSIGFIFLRNVCHRSRRAEVSLYIGEKLQWKKGYGSDALAALIRFAFYDLNLHRLWLECDPRHERIVRAYEKLGFKREGTLKESYFRDGEFRDTLILALLKSEWIFS